MSGITETEAAKAARAEFANDLCGMTDADIAREIENSRREIEEIEPWLEALVAEQEHRLLDAATNGKASGAHREDKP